MKIRTFYSILISFIALSITLSAKDDRISKFFEKYQNNKAYEGITYVNFTPTPALIEGMKDRIQDKEAIEMLKNIKSIVILSTKNNSDKKYQFKGGETEVIYNDALNSLPLNEFEKFLEIKEGNKHIRMLYKNSTEKSKAKEFLMIAKEDNEISIIWVEGLIDLKDLNKLSKTVGKGFK